MTGSASIWLQYKLLLWKNFTLRRRRPFFLFLEIVAPVLIVALLAVIRTRDLVFPYPVCHLQPKPLPSSGTIPWLQGQICNFNNSCFREKTDYSMPNSQNVNASRMIDSLSDLLEAENIEKINNAVSLLSNFGGQVMTEFQNVSLGSALSNMNATRTNLQKALREGNISLSNAAWNELINSSTNLAELITQMTFSNWTNICQTAQNTQYNTMKTLTTELCGFTDQQRQAFQGAVVSAVMSINPQELLQNVGNMTLGGMMSTYNETITKMTTTLKNNNITLSETAWNELRSSNMSVGQILAIMPDFNITAVCNSDNEKNRLISMKTLIEEVCNMTMAERNAFTDAITSAVDPMKLMRSRANLFRSGQTMLPMLRGNLTNILQSFETLASSMNAVMVNFQGSTANENDAGEISQILSLAKMACGEHSDFYKIMKKQAKPQKKTPNGLKRKKREVVGGKEASQNLTMCQSILKTLNSKELGKVYSRIGLNYIFEGSIYYTPDTKLTRKFIQHSNFTFGGIGKFVDASKLWVDTLLPMFKSQKTVMVNAIKQILVLCDSLPSNSIAICQDLKSAGNIDNQFLNYLNTITEFFNMISNTLGCFNWNKFVPKKSESDFSAITDKNANETIWMGIVFDGVPEDDNTPIDKVNFDHISVRIRMRTDEVDGTRQFKVLDKYWSQRPRRSFPTDIKYFAYGFIHIQDLVIKGIITALNDDKPLDYGVHMQQIPYPCYTIDKFTMIVSRSLPLFMTLGWIFAVSMSVKAIVHEKEKRLKEVMRVMGLSNGIHWCGWWTTSLVLMTSSTFIISLFLKFGSILGASAWSLIFFVLFSFVVVSIAQCFFISIFFSKANIAATMAGIIYFISYLPFGSVQLNEDAITESGLYAVSLLSPVAFGLCCQYFARYEDTGKGMQWADLFISPTPGDPFSLGQAVAMMWIDALLYIILIWYIESVFPGQYGVPKKWYFPFTKSYWCGTDSKHLKTDDDALFTPITGDNFEAEPEGLKLGVAIRNLHKVYKKGKPPAVDGLNLNFFENQITSFLGHNGAGKTTTISILTGLYTPTKGSAYIYGRNIAEDMDAIRHNLGLCPQHNVLFDFMTVEEHIYFYGLLKGMHQKDMENEITTFVNDVGLPHKRKELSSNLSGGMKRKLSVAMAFVGGSKLVILDEPTAGVDPYARRSIWDLLVKCRENRTIILTTHHMDEADVLGDRIAIISKGKLKCCGSSIFLKNLFGSGYHLVLAKQDSSDKNIVEEGNEEDALTFVQRRIPSAELVEETDTEWVFKLPLSGLSDGSYQNLFTDLDSNMKKLKVSSYGLSDTSLEEVFLTVADDPAGEAVKSKTADMSESSVDLLTENGLYPRPVTRSSLRRSLSISSGKRCCFDNLKKSTSSKKSTNSPTNNLTCNGTGTYRVTGLKFLLTHFLALWIKRFHNMKRNKKGFIAELVVPPVFILIAVILVKIAPQPTPHPPMEVHPWLMKPERSPHLHVFYSNANQSNAWTTMLSDHTRTNLGVGGVRCMNSSIYSIDGYPCENKWLNEAWSEAPHYVPQRTPDCHCPKNKQQVCSDVRSGGPVASKRVMATTDYLHNVSGYNISDYLIKTHSHFERLRFGGFEFSQHNQTKRNPISNDKLQSLLKNNDVSTFLNDMKVFVTSLFEPSYKAVVYFKNKGYVSSVAYLSIVQNMMMRSTQKNVHAMFNKGISVINHPLNLTEEDLWEDANRSSQISLLMSICVIFALAFIPASFVIFLIEERVTNAKHLQFVSGVNPYVYWIANYLWDMVNYMVACLLCIFIFLAFQMHEYVGSEQFPPFLLLMFCYGFAVIPLMYPASFVFKTPSSAFVIVSSINLAIGIVATLAVYIISMLEDDDEDLKKINNILKIVFLFFPQYCLGRGLMDMSTNYVYTKLGFSFLSNGGLLAWDNLGKNIFCLIIQSIVYFILVILIERKFFCGRLDCCVNKNMSMSIEDEDEDVAAERKRVLSHGAEEDAVRLVNLTKIYSGNKLKRPAVNQLCLGIKKGQCFGLLGVNGAGKTSTFMMLTGQQNVTRGDAFVGNKSVRSDLIEVHRSIGYCPQFDALNNLLTGRETLSLYARLRGIPSNEINWVVEWALNRLSLMPHADKPAGTYSGGNKRKLSTAIALIGNPDVIFLDEPTSGMDPGAKRFLWNCISEIVQEGRSVVLTTHSMEECEALCQRLCIMVNGTLKCLGSVQHLKSKFGEGYTVALKLRSANMNVDDVIEFMNVCFPGCELKESNYTLLEFKLGSEINLSYLFECLQEGKLKHKYFEDYSVSQTTLDQVFIDFAKYQSEMFNEEEQLSKTQTSEDLDEITYHEKNQNGTLNPTAPVVLLSPLKKLENLPETPPPFPDDMAAIRIDTDSCPSVRVYQDRAASQLSDVDV